MGFPHHLGITVLQSHACREGAEGLLLDCWFQATPAWKWKVTYIRTHTKNRNPYICFHNYCSCFDFAQEVVTSKKMFCKHLLAVRLCSISAWENLSIRYASDFELSVWLDSTLSESRRRMPWLQYNMTDSRLVSKETCWWGGFLQGLQIKKSSREHCIGRVDLEWP